jgi:mannose-6-phosphate isomerase-like protein (cupin superfamily)
MQTKPLQIKPYMLNDGQPGFPFLDMTVSVKASSAQTDGTFSLFEVLLPVEYKTPLHIHYLEDVAIFVLDGNLQIYWGTEKMQASAGSYFFQPKGTLHGFRVEGDVPARILYITIPAGLDRFVFTPDMSSGDCGVTAAARCKIEIVGPLPDSEKQKENPYG